ncbi:MAG: hypothetical protein ACLFUE_11495 [Desulfobacteraceae bacterium]
MFGRRLKLFRLMGFEVKVDLSWIALALLGYPAMIKGPLAVFNLMHATHN